MKRCIIAMVAIVLASQRLCHCEATDAQIKEAFIAAAKPMCSMEATIARRRAAVNLCGGDKARHARLVAEIAKERPDLTKWAIVESSKSGSREALPFLFGYTNDVRYCELAALAIVRVDGVTSNSLAIVEHSFAIAPDKAGLKHEICAEIAEASRSASVDGRRLARDKLLGFMALSAHVALAADEALVELDSGYSTSAKRRDVLERMADSADSHGVKHYAECALRNIDSEKRQMQRGRDEK